MSTMQINLSEPLQRFVVGQVAELGLDCPDQYFERLLEDCTFQEFEQNTT